MSGSPTNVDLNDSTPGPKPDTCNVEWQAGIAVPDPNSPGNYVRETSACYRYPQVGGVSLITADYDLSLVDSGYILVCNSATAITLKLPATIPFFGSPAQGNWNITIVNLGAGTVTLNPNGPNLDGSASTLSIEQFQRISISTDGTDYYSGPKASGFVGGVIANTGTSITVGNTHRQKLLTTSNASAIAVTLDSTVGKAFMSWLINLGAGTATLTPSSGTINGAATLALTTGQGCTLFFDGTNWEAVTGGGGASPLTTKGDLYGRSTVDARIPVGTDGQVLQADSTQTLGVKWVSQPYDLGFQISNKPPANTRYLVWVFTRPVTFPANFSGGQGRDLTNPAATATFTLEKIPSGGSPTNCGTVVISTSGVFSFTSASGTPVTFAAGDSLSVVTPTVQDTTLSDVAFTLVGTR